MSTRSYCASHTLQLTHYESSDEGVTLHFDRGQPPVRAKLLVGADGYFSKIRKQCLNDGFTPSAESMLIQYDIADSSSNAAKQFSPAGVPCLLMRLLTVAHVCIQLFQPDCNSA